MIDFNIAINLIKRNGGFKPNRHEDSFYRTYITQENRPLQVRISNHGTHLWTWYDKGYDPAYAINTCVVYSKDGTHNSNVEVDINIKDKYNNIIGQRKSFEVIQYVYNCQLLDENDSALINQAVQSIWQNKGYNDPLANTPKHAKVYRLRPNQAIETIVENKQYDNKNENMKQIVKLTESDLHRVIKESVKKILQENDFTPHGYKATSAFDGYEVQLDDRGENARLRNFYDGTITDWLEIQFDENGVAYIIDENGEEERLCDYMRY